MCDEVKKLVFASGTLEPAADFDLVKSKKHKF
jgi:Rad3-related DNA helicase